MKKQFASVLAAMTAAAMPVVKRGFFFKMH